jgi:hypothetical protein
MFLSERGKGNKTMEDFDNFDTQVQCEEVYEGKYTKEEYDEYMQFICQDSQFWDEVLKFE